MSKFERNSLNSTCLHFNGEFARNISAHLCFLLKPFFWMKLLSFKTAADRQIGRVRNDLAMVGPSPLLWIDRHLMVEDVENLIFTWAIMSSCKFRINFNEEIWMGETREREADWLIKVDCKKRTIKLASQLIRCSEFGVTFQLLRTFGSKKKYEEIESGGSLPLQFAFKIASNLLSFCNEQFDR